MVDRIPELLAELDRSGDWMSASLLADRLGVSTRTVRSWVTAVRTAAGPIEVIASSPEGYRLNHEGAATFRDRPRGTPTTPQGRVSFLVSALTKSDDGVDLHAAAELLHVSESTVEADLARVRTLARETNLEVVRSGSRVRLDGGAAGQRRLVSRIFRQEQVAGPLDLPAIERAFPIGDLRAFKSDLMALLDELSFEINELGLDGVLVHTAISVDRAGSALRRVEEPPKAASRNPTSEDAPAAPDPLTAPFASLITRHFHVALPPEETDALVQLIHLRAGSALRTPDPSLLEVVGGIVRRAEDEFLVDLDDPEFLDRLALHVQNLVARARSGDGARNPLTRTIKSSYPLTYELAVFLAAELQTAFDITTTDDEIAYIALHVGTQLARADRGAVSVTVVSPRYLDLGAQLARRVEEHLGGQGRVDLVVERSDQRLEQLPGEVIVAAVPGARTGGRVVAVGPLPTDAELSAVRDAVDRAHRIRRRRAIAEALGAYFDADLFARRPPGADEEEIIRMLGALLLRRGVVDEAWIEGAIARERLSSTAFTDTLAVPHSLELTAARTGIAVAILDSPMPWGDGTVQVVALVAFGNDRRETFQTVFDQFVEAFADRAAVARLIADSRDAGAFVDALAGLIDE